MVKSKACSQAGHRPDHAVVVEDGVQRHVVRLGLEIVQVALGEPQAHGERLGLQCGQRAVVETAAVAQAVAPRPIAHAGHEQQGGDDDLGVLGLGNAVGILLHRATRVPRVEGQRLVHLVDHGQADAAQLRLVQQFAVLLPAVQRGQGVELTLDRPVGADDEIGAPHEPDAHHLLQKCCTL